MNAKIWVSAVTAGVIAMGGALGVVLVGDKPTLWQFLAALVLGIVVAAKDIRSQLQLPPVEGDAVKPPTRLPLILLVGLMGLMGLLAGCAPLNDRVEAGGAYHAGDVVHGELYVVDASFDLAHAGLDGVFKYEQANRQLLWNISPNIKRSLDKIRLEARVAKRDYAVAREAYLKQPAIGLGELNAALFKLQSANVAALTVIEGKGIKP